MLIDTSQLFTLFACHKLARKCIKMRHLAGFRYGRAHYSHPASLYAWVIPLFGVEAALPPRTDPILHDPAENRNTNRPEMTRNSELS